MGVKKMRRLYTNKKAVSPVIATVLMILVTMAGMTILFGFVTSYSEIYKEGAGSQVLELLTVEDVWIKSDNPPNPVQITVYNAGKIDSQITSVYVNGLALTEASGGSDFNLDNFIVKQGDHLTFTVYSKGITLYSGQPYTFTIGTKTGSTFEVPYSPLR
jgi:flagellin-like protein